MLSLAAAANAQDWDEWYGERREPLPPPVAEPSYAKPSVSVRGSIGITQDPETFLLGIAFPIALNDNLAFTPLVEASFDDGRTIVAPTANLEYSFDVGDSRLRPFVSTGVGFAYIREDRPGGDTDDVGFLIAPGVGLEYELSPNLQIGTNVRFNVLPSDVADQSFYLSWHFATLRVRF